MKTLTLSLLSALLLPLAASAATNIHCSAIPAFSFGAENEGSITQPGTHFQIRVDNMLSHSFRAVSESVAVNGNQVTVNFTTVSPQGERNDRSIGARLELTIADTQLGTVEQEGRVVITARPKTPYRDLRSSYSLSSCTGTL